jgi:hypothetical protein
VATLKVTTIEKGSELYQAINNYRYTLDRDSCNVVVNLAHLIVGDKDLSIADKLDVLKKLPSDLLVASAVSTEGNEGFCALQEMEVLLCNGGATSQQQIDLYNLISPNKTNCPDRFFEDVVRPLIDLSKVDQGTQSILNLEGLLAVLTQLSSEQLRRAVYYRFTVAGHELSVIQRAFFNLESSVAFFDLIIKKKALYGLYFSEKKERTVLNRFFGEGSRLPLAEYSFNFVVSGFIPYLETVGFSLGKAFAYECDLANRCVSLKLGVLLVAINDQARCDSVDLRKFNNALCLFSLLWQKVTGDGVAVCYPVLLAQVQKLDLSMKDGWFGQNRIGTSPWNNPISALSSCGFDFNAALVSLDKSQYPSSANSLEKQIVERWLSLSTTTAWLDALKAQLLTRS